MRVLNLVKTSVGGSWALRQMKVLADLGVDVHVALPERNALWDRYCENGINAHLLQTDFPLKKLWVLPLRIRKLKRLVKYIKPDIVHSHFVGTTLTMRLALKEMNDLPRIFQVPGPLHLEQKMFRAAEIATAAQNDFWIATCSATKRRYLNSGINESKVFFTYYGTETKNFSNRKIQGKLRKELGIREQIPLLGMVAYMYKPKYMMGKRRGVKGHEDLIDAVAIVATKMPELKVVFVGGAWNGAYAYENKILRYANEKIIDHAIFLGNRSDVNELYSDFNAAVHPSHSENLGGAVESLLMGVPTIATNVGGFPDVVIPGRTGYLTPPKNPEKLAETILHVLKHQKEARKFASVGRQWVMDNCDVSVTANQVFKIYNKLYSFGFLKKSYWMPQHQKI